jgi:pSer/pThr/pTyr-binding forkhead associated (FHA) protein
VNGVQVERRPVPLRPGDRITLGETELVFHDRIRRPDGPGRVAGARAPPRSAGRGGVTPGLRPLLLAAFLAFSAAALALASSFG